MRSAVSILGHKNVRKGHCDIPPHRSSVSPGVSVFKLAYLGVPVNWKEWAWSSVLIEDFVSLLCLVL